MDSIIFDIDGTLWDSTGIVADAWNECLKNRGIPVRVTGTQLKSLFGQLLMDIARQIFRDYPEEMQASLIEDCCRAEHEALRLRPAPLYPSLPETLEVLSGKYPLFIVSNCQAGYIELFLASTGLGRFFRGHLCPGDTNLAKAENILKIAELYHLSSPVYVGDTLGDFTACRKAGVPFVYASYGFGQVEAPYYRIEKPLDLVSLF